MKKLLVIGFAALIIGAYVVPKAMAEKKDNEKIPDQYIVLLKDGADVDATTESMVNNQGLGHLFTYKHALRGFAAIIPLNKLDKIKNDPRVALVAEDKVVTAFGKPSAPVVPAQVIPTGIDRIDAENLTNTGDGVNVAVIDTGIDLTHPDLKGRIAGGINCSSGSSYTDGNGHGTHVAGTIAALNNNIGVVGVVPGARLWSVRVLNNRGSGSIGSVICGLDWITKQNTDASATNDIKVANMSLGAGGSNDNQCGLANGDLMHQAICRSRDTGVTFVVAAGNGDSYGRPVNASNVVPAAYDDAVITVSALADYDGKAGADDIFASFSNYGSVVDIGAPGVNILSTWKGGGYNIISGTSMATPHASGAAALYISANPGSSWVEVRDGLRAEGEALGSGHSDPSGNHPEPVVNVGLTL